MAAKKKRRWSQRVTATSNALDLDKGVFSLTDPRGIARSLKRSADRSRRRKTDPFRSAMSMLNFYINRAGRKLSKSRRGRLQAAKGELRKLYDRKAPGLAFRNRQSPPCGTASNPDLPLAERL